jgi:hypothetical protein
MLAQNQRSGMNGQISPNIDYLASAPRCAAAVCSDASGKELLIQQERHPQVQLQLPCCLKSLGADELVGV